MSTNQEWKARKDAATPKGVGVMCSFYAERAKNAEIWDVEGRRTIDFASGIAVLNTGHNHPKIVAAIKAQLDQFTHTCYQVVPYGNYVELAEKINQITPGTHAKKTAFFSTGVEAVENAIKIARSYTKRTGIIAFSGAFHGRTSMGMALTGKVDPYKIGFGPFPSEIYHAPFPNEVHGMSVEAAIASLKTLFKSDIEASKVAAIIFEPVQGEGGFNIAPKAFVQALRTVCDEYGILLIADEIQTGFARTGKLFAMEHYGVIPDLMTIAKSLAGGMPLSGVCGKAEIMDAPNPGGLGGTYAGNALAIASALAVLEVIEEEQLVARANVLGERLKQQLQQSMEAPHLKARVADIRGLGAMVAIEFKHPTTGEPDAAYTKKVQTVALENGLLLLTCGVYGNVIRFLFPLTISDAVLAEGLAILDKALSVN